MRPVTRRAMPLHILALAGVFGLLTIGCATDAEKADGPRVPVTASDFADATVSRGTDAPAPLPMVPRGVATAGGGEVRVSVAGPSGGTGGGGSGRPVVAQPPGETQRFLVDEMVGQVNGKPIYADEFFSDMDARLRAEAKRMPLNKWVKMVTENVAGKLRTETQDELLLSEFESSLTAEQRVGVLSFIEDLRKNIQRGYGGSTELANQRLQEEEGVTLREKVQDEAERQFIIAQLRETIAKRVQISYKDIELYYSQNIDKYRPPGDAVFRVIRVPIANEARINAVEAGLASGESPIDIAAKYSDWAKDDGNIQRVTLEDGSLATTVIWGPESLNTASQQLEPGQITPRIDLGSRAWWVYLEAIEHPPGKSLYDVQLDIEQLVKNERIRQEEGRYWESLLQRSNMTQFDEMVKRLVAYAAERYYVRDIYQDGKIEVIGGDEDAGDGSGDTTGSPEGDGAASPGDAGKD